MQLLLRQHGLLDEYLTATTSVLLGTQAALMAATSNSRNNSSCGVKKAAGTGREAGAAAVAGIRDFRIAASYAGATGQSPHPLLPAAAAAGSDSQKKKDKRQLHKIVSARMQREVRLTRRQARTWLQHHLSPNNHLASVVQPSTTLNNTA